MRPRKITLHCANSPNGQHLPIGLLEALHAGSPDSEVDWFGRMLHGRGWRKIGYQIVIQPDGQKITFPQCRAMNEQGAHVLGANRDNIGICFAGTDHFTEAQFATLKYQLDSIFLTYDTVPKWAIYGHYEFESAKRTGKTCPNMNMNRVRYWYLTQDWNAIDRYLLRDGITGRPYPW